ncbi:MAG TPA: phosphate ABC transporter permease subunit PstC, partial [Oceanicaulis sp.]|nr:phosphate ABC transporter permease subunit PstC [Oceanicaulis sp.]
MQLSLITALALLVLTAVGFLAGRSRALAIAEKDGSRLHSLPGYHGYYVALWAGLPGFAVLAAYALAGTMIVNTIVLDRMERAAEPLQARYELALANDDIWSEAEREIARLDDEMAALRGEAEQVIAAEGVQSDAVEALRARQDELQFAQDDARFTRDARADTIAGDIIQAVPEAGDHALARAGFEFARLPVQEREVFLADARALAFGDGLASRDTPELRATAGALQPVHSAIAWGACLGALGLALAGLAFARTHLAVRFRARNRVEWVISATLALASLIAILTTLGIVFSLLFESLRFFAAIDWRV